MCKDVGGLKSGVSYPSSYNLKYLGLVNNMEDQLSGGSCWAFATTESIESNLLKT